MLSFFVLFYFTSFCPEDYREEILEETFANYFLIFSLLLLFQELKNMVLIEILAPNLKNNENFPLDRVCYMVKFSRCTASRVWPLKNPK